MMDRATAAGAAGEGRAFDIFRPERLTTGAIFASPHSGRDYPEAFLAASRLDRRALRQSEDGYVDLLFDGAPAQGAPFLRARFPRAYVDVNRARDEIDPRMFADATPRGVDSRSSRVAAGLGVIPRIVADGQDIYARKLRYREAVRRLEIYYDAYHRALGRLIDEARQRFGAAILIDCHSMPSASSAALRGDAAGGVDFVLGDRFGASCAPAVTRAAERYLEAAGYVVSRNAPYAGGYVASAYGRPAENVHVLQIEINRALYLDEPNVARVEGFEPLRERMSGFIEAICALRSDELWPAQAAE